MADRSEPRIEIVEQPASREYRFRYECERRSHGSIPGVNSTSRKKTYPKIRIVGLNTEAHVIVSCVTRDAPYRAHPHHLVTKNAVNNHGVYVAKASPTCNEVELKHVGIQCVRKKDIKASLEDRKRMRVDPFQQGFEHMDLTMGFELNVVRLCFQVFLFDKATGKYTKRLTPVVTDPIVDKQAASNLMISKLSTCVGSTAGGSSLTILGYKVIKEDIKVRFFEERNEQVVWEAVVDPLPRAAGESLASITVTTPRYYNRTSMDKIPIEVQLIKPSTGESGKSMPFHLLPGSQYGEEPEEDAPIDLSSKRKRQEFSSDFMNYDTPLNDLNMTPKDLKFEGEAGNWNIPPMRNELLYQNLNSGGSLIQPQKRLKYAEAYPMPMAPLLSPLVPIPRYYPAMYADQLPMDYVSYPGVLFYPMPAPLSPQFVYDHHFLPNNLQRDLRQDQDGSVQPEPILQPIIVNVSEKDIDPPINFDVNANDELHANNGQIDFEKYISSLSDSLSNIKIGNDSAPKEASKSEEKKGNTEERLSQFCDNTIQEILRISKLTNCGEQNVER